MAAVALFGAFASFVPTLSRRAVLSAAALSVSLPNHARAADNPPLLPVPPSAILLRMVDTTTRMEAEMKRAAAGTDLGPPISREEMNYSINVLLQSTQLATFPNAGEAADTLRGVKTIAGGSKRELSGDEFV